MATNIFLTLANGAQQLVKAIASSAGVADANKIVSTDATGYISETLFPPGIPFTAESRVVTENVAAGDLVNEWDDAGTTKIRLANASNGREATGFVLAAFTVGQAATVYPMGEVNTAMTGLTVGTKYYLSNISSGKVITGATLFAGAANGHLIQLVGRATGATELETGKYSVIEYQAD